MKTPTWREVAELLAAALRQRCALDSTCKCASCSALRAFSKAVALEDARAAADCPGDGSCHGSMKWCEVCGDVARVCDDPQCDQHPSPGYQPNALRSGHFGAGGRIERGRLPDDSDEGGPIAAAGRDSSPPASLSLGGAG